MIVYIEMLILADDEKNSPSWKKFFAAHSDVECVEWCGTAAGADDVTVYFYDCEEPFPVTSLLAASCIRSDLEDQISWAP